MCDLICDVISCCDTDNIYVYETNRD